MFDIIEVVNLQDELKNCARRLTKTYIESHKHTKKNLEEESFTNISPRVIGVKDNNLYLFTWNCEELCHSKTFIGVFKRDSRLSEIIFTHQNILFIINASINCSSKLLAYSCIEKKCNSEDLYCSYISEIHPQKNLYSLNIKWKVYQKVQFLKDSSKTCKVSHLLFFHHRETISLYRIPAITGKDDLLKSAELSVVSVVSRFIWAQFDFKFNRLFYVDLNPSDEDDSASEGIFNAVEFDEHGKFHLVFNFSLPLEFNLEFMQLKDVYNNLLYTDIVSYSFFNMRVLQSDGSLYICYQQSKNNQLNSSESCISSSEIETISYAICCMHSGYKLDCSTFNVSGSSQHICFTLYNDFVLVYAYKSFFHLLDISYEHEPIHNILVNCKSPFFPKIKLSSNVLLSLIDSTNIFDICSQKIFNFQISTSLLFEMFCCSDVATRLSILHIVVIHLNDKQVCRNIIKVLTQEYLNQEACNLLKEYFLARNYVKMWKYVSSKTDLRLFPFTTQSFYKDQIECSDSGKKNACLEYSFYSETGIVQLKKNLFKNKKNFWASIHNNLCYQSALKSESKRFPIKLLFLAGVELNDESLSFDVLTLKQCYASQSNSEMNNIVIQKMVSYTLTNHRELSKDIVFSLCTEYAIERINILKRLWKQILKTIGAKPYETIINTSILNLLDKNEVMLFHMLQVIKMVCAELCLPDVYGIKNLLCFLGFRYLKHHQFLSYVDSFVIEINYNFGKQIFEELDDSSDNLIFKVNLLKHFNAETAKDLIKLWNSKSGNRHLLQQALSGLTYKVKKKPNITDLSLTGEAFEALHALIGCINWQKKEVTFISEVETVELLQNASLVDTEALVKKEIQKENPS